MESVGLPESHKFFCKALCWENLIIEDRGLKFWYMVDDYLLMTFLKEKLKKVVPGLSQAYFSAGFWGSSGDFWKIEPLSFWQSFIIEDRGLNFEYRVYGNPLINF